MNFRNCFALFVFFLLLACKVSGHFQNMPMSDTINWLSVDSLLNILEKKHNIRFYYEEKIIAGHKLPLSLSALQLDEALIRLEQIIKCSYVIVDTSSCILMPSIIQGDLQLKDQGYLIVGNPNNYGKYKTATLTGILMDDKTGEPLAGAVANVKKLNIAATTDKTGTFTMNLPVGEYELEFSYFNYTRNFQKIKLVSDGKATFNLIEKMVALNEVIIHAEKSESNVSHTQMSIMRLDLKSIKELPLSIGEKDIIRSMTLLPGVQSVGEFGSGFNVRGGSADQNLILLEDAPLFNSSHLFGLESVINPDGISAITLLKAGIPAQYGERVSSITNIGLGSNPSEMKVRGGIGLLSSRLNMETPLVKGKVDLLIGGRSSYSNWLLHQIPDANLMNSSAYFYDLNALLNIKINTKNRIGFFAYYSNDKFRYDITNRYNYTSTLGSIHWSHTFNDKLSSKLTTAYSRYKYNFTDYDNLVPVDAYQISSSLQYNSLKYNMSWIPNEKYSFDFGLNGILYISHPGSQEAFGNHSTILPLKINPEKGAEMAAYFSGNIEITKNLSAELGIRYSEFVLLGPGTIYSYMTGQTRSVNTISDTTRYGNNSIINHYAGLEPRFSFRFAINEFSSIKLSFNRIDQYINLISNTSVAIPSDIWKLSSPQLKPLIADQVAIGFYRNFKQNSIETSLELYYKSLKNITEYKNGAQLLLNEHIETDLLEAFGYNYGLELFVKKKTGLLTGWISYTFSISLRHTISLFEEDQINGNKYFPSNYDKPNSLNIVASYSLTRRWHFSGSFSYSTGRPVTLPESKFQYGSDWLVIYSSRNKYRLPDYHRLDLSITFDESLKIKKKWKGSWTFSIINVYGRKNAFSTFYKKEVPDLSNNFSPYNLYTLYIIGRPLPTLTYSFSF